VTGEHDGAVDRLDELGQVSRVAGEGAQWVGERDHPVLVAGFGNYLSRKLLLAPGIGADRGDMRASPNAASITGSTARVAVTIKLQAWVRSFMSRVNVKAKPSGSMSRL
jgi:hypothetical protein